MLLSAALIMAALSANAQDNFVIVDGATMGLNDASAIAVPAGTEVCKTADGMVSLKVKFEDTYKNVGMKDGDVLINGTALSFPEKGAIQGTTNPPASSSQTTSLPTSGAVFSVDIAETAPENGIYVYMIISASGNKPYAVYENDYRIPFIFSMENTGGDALKDPGTPASETFAYDLSKVEGATEVDEYGVTILKADYPIWWAGEYFLGEDVTGEAENPLKTTGNGVIKFNAFPGLSYSVFATGSKMTIGAIGYDTTGDATITTDTHTLLEAGQVPGNGGGTGIAGVEVKDEVDANAPVYNIAGQRVSKDAKGLVIVNGKKYLRK